MKDSLVGHDAVTLADLATSEQAVLEGKLVAYRRTPVAVGLTGWALFEVHRYRLQAPTDISKPPKVKTLKTIMPPTRRVGGTLPVRGAGRISAIPLIRHPKPLAKDSLCSGR